MAIRIIRFLSPGRAHLSLNPGLGRRGRRVGALRAGGGRRDLAQDLRSRIEAAPIERMK